MIPQEAVEAAMSTVREDLQHPLHWSPRRIATRVIKAAAPFIRAKVLEAVADELDRLHRIGATRSDQCTPEEKADYRAYAKFEGGHSAWLRARAATERGRG